MAQTLKLKKYITIQGKLICKTGLRIGGSKEELEIGGLDNPIIRDPVDELPYIPGSSIKGKMRSLLEYKYNRVGPNGNPCGCGKPLDECPVCTIFGPHMKPAHDLGPSRLIVRDCLLSEESRANLAKLGKQGLGYSELKTENIIDRRTGTARAGGLRTMERVPKGTEFNLNISVRVFEQDDEAKMFGYVKEALELLQKDYLGGSGTRGYGWVGVQYEVVPD
jgi:CRISPR-associated protein Csm3